MQVCQPQLWASLRKGWFRMIGTVVGATVIVTLTACFPQDRIAFLGLLALWGGLCAFVATALRNFASYSAALAGYTAAIIAADTLGRLEGRALTSSCWQSGGPARSASASYAPASSSPGPISGAPSGGLQRHSPIWRSG
jgi:Fusaric acid resistance protein family